MERSIYLAYDGSINADWVARYALRITCTVPDRRLRLVHIHDGTISGEKLAAKLERIGAECRAMEVELSVSTVSLQGDVLTTLMATIPMGPEVYCLCGARATSREKGFLAGTVSQRLLRARRFNTLAVRVVNPGQLGCPANVMFPLAGHPRKFMAAMPFLRMLAPCVKKVILLRIMTVNPLFFRYLSAARARTLLREGAGYVREVMGDIAHEMDAGSFHVDDHVLISDDWVKEILIQAGKTRAGLILLGASDRFLQSRFFYGNKIEQILRHTPCDVGIYRKI
jgi:nucleotide-binding universal stress UspA family protein